MARTTSSAASASRRDSTSKAGLAGQQKHFCSGMLLFRQHKINGPAAARVGSWTAEMIEDRLVGAAGFFQRVGKHAQAGCVQLATGVVALSVGRLGKPLHGPIVPGEQGRVDVGWRPKGIVEEIALEQNSDPPPPLCDGPEKVAWPPFGRYAVRFLVP